MIVIVTGTPEWSNERIVYEQLIELEPRSTLRVVRSADLLDAIVVDLAKVVDHHVERHFVDAGAHGQAARGATNQEMVDALPRADLVIAFMLPEYTGANAHKRRNAAAHDCIRRALAERIKVRAVDVTGREQESAPRRTGRRVARAS